jgi:hypothetical protein
MPSEHRTVARLDIDSNPDAELDELVAAEMAELRPALRVGAAPPSERGELPVEEPIDSALERLAQRLHIHPERAHLLDRLRVAVLGEENKILEAPAAATPRASPE